MEIRKYVLVDRDDDEGDWEFDTREAAIDEAKRQDCAVLGRTYEYSDSDLVWTPDGSDSWPPKE